MRHLLFATHHGHSLFGYRPFKRRRYLDDHCDGGLPPSKLPPFLLRPLAKRHYYKKKEEGSEAPDRNSDIVEDAYIYLEKNRHGATKRVKVCWIAKRTLFYEPDDYVAEESQASPFTKTKDKDASAQNYEFDRSGTEPEEPQDNEMSDYNPDEDRMFDDVNSDFPDTF